MARIIMRACRNPACTKGEFPSSTARAAYCSSACRLIHHRAAKKSVTSTIKTEGNNTMSQLFQPDAAHLKRLQDIEVARYNTGTQCNIQGKENLGIMEEFEVRGLQQALDRYVELTKQGYVATGEIAHLPKLLATPTDEWLLLSLRKPEAQVEKDFAEILARVESEYLARLEAEKSAAVAKEVESLLAATRRKQQQAELDAKATKEAEEYARVEAEVLAALGGKQ